MTEDRRAMVQEIIDALYGSRYVEVGNTTYRYLARDFQRIPNRDLGDKRVRWTNCSLGTIVDAVMDADKKAVIIEPEFDLGFEDALRSLAHYNKVEFRFMEWGEPRYITIDLHSPLTIIDQKSGKPFTFDGCSMTRGRVVE